MEEIRKILQKGETILWKRIKNIDLTRHFRIYSNLDFWCFTLIFIILLIYTIIATNSYILIFLILFNIILFSSINVPFTIRDIKGKRDLNKFFNKNPELMKNYQEIELITNMRIIKKNCLFLLKNEKVIANESLKCLIIDKDIVSLYFKSIDKLKVKNNFKRIVFLFDTTKKEKLFYIDKKENIWDLFESLNLLIKVIPLKKLDANRSEIMFIKKDENEN